MGVVPQIYGGNRVGSRILALSCADGWREPETILPRPGPIDFPCHAPFRIIDGRFDAVRDDGREVRLIFLIIEPQHHGESNRVSFDQSEISIFSLFALNLSELVGGQAGAEFEQGSVEVFQHGVPEWMLPPSDGCRTVAFPLAVEWWYDFPEP